MSIFLREPVFAPHRRTRLRYRWTCSNFAKHAHRWRWIAWLCGRVQRALRAKEAV